MKRMKFFSIAAVLLVMTAAILFVAHEAYAEDEGHIITSVEATEVDQVQDVIPEYDEEEETWVVVIIVAILVFGFAYSMARKKR